MGTRSLDPPSVSLGLGPGGCVGVGAGVPDRPAGGRQPRAPAPFPGPSPSADVKESRKDVLPGAEDSLPREAHAGNLARCAELTQSQASLQSASSVGSARGDEGAGYTDIYGDYRPLFDNSQDPDNVSLQGGRRRLGRAAEGLPRRVG